uniref:Uncharacterized protein n=1 Tax=Cannabis sativa TaxID=3483 RepID=A0A803QGL3_CANSA
MENSATDLQPLEQFSSDSAIQPQVTWQLNALQEASGEKYLNHGSSLLADDNGATIPSAPLSQTATTEVDFLSLGFHFS